MVTKRQGLWQMWHLIFWDMLQAHPKSHCWTFKPHPGAHPDQQTTGGLQSCTCWEKLVHLGKCNWQPCHKRSWEWAWTRQRHWVPSWHTQECVAKGTLGGSVMDEISTALTSQDLAFGGKVIAILDRLTLKPIISKVEPCCCFVLLCGTVSQFHQGVSKTQLMPLAWSSWMGGRARDHERRRKRRHHQHSVECHQSYTHGLQSSKWVWRIDTSNGQMHDCQRLHIDWCDSHHLSKWPGKPAIKGAWVADGRPGRHLTSRAKLDIGHHSGPS